jgi:hypothetical protein
VNGKLECRVLMQHAQKRPIAAYMRIIQHALEIAHGLVRMDSQQKCNGLGQITLLSLQSLKVYVS